MIRLRYLLTASILIAAIAAIGCRKEAPDTQASTSQDPPSTASAPYDQQFIDMMSKHHRGAIQMAQMAQGKIENSGLKDLVKRIPIDQQKEIDQMKAWRDQWYPGAAIAEDMNMPGMSSGMNMDMSHMESMKAGHDYDAMFIDMMVPHHESAVAIARDAVGKGEHQEIKTLAQQIIDAQTKEIDQMKKWRATLGKG